MASRVARGEKGHGCKFSIVLFKNTNDIIKTTPKLLRDMQMYYVRVEGRNSCSKSTKDGPRYKKEERILVACG